MSINSSRMSVTLQSMLHHTSHSDSLLFYWSGARHSVFFLCDVKTPFWKHQDWYPASLPVISESENRIYCAVNFCGNCQSVALIKPGTHRKMSVLNIGNFICVFIHCMLVLIEFFNILNWVNMQKRCLTKLLVIIQK